MCYYLQLGISTLIFADKEFFFLVEEKLVISPLHLGVRCLRASNALGRQMTPWDYRGVKGYGCIKRLLSKIMKSQAFWSDSDVPIIKRLRLQWTWIHFINCNSIKSSLHFSKGQIISKGLLVSSNSPKKTNKQFFWKIRGHQNRIIWPLDCPGTSWKCLQYSKFRLT